MFFFRYLNYLNKELFIKKIILVTIFLSIFALIFSSIALYFGQLNQSTYVVINNIKHHQNLIQEYSNKIIKNKFNLLKAEKSSFNYYLSDRQRKLNNIHDVEYNYCFSLQQSIRISVFDMKPVLDKAKIYLTKEWDTDTFKQKYNFNYMDKTVNDLFDLFLSKNSPTLCQNKQLTEIKSIHSQQKHFNDRLLYLIKDLKLKSKERMDGAFNELNINFKNTTNFILIAFFIQLLIFLIISVLDIRSVFSFGSKK